MAEETVNLGSSPHTRGAPGLLTLIGSDSQDHPRIRGEHPHVQRQHEARGGIIPAYAGSTPGLRLVLAAVMGSSPHTRGALSAISLRIPSIRDHPRIRGEHPRVDAVRVRDAGIIPAYAGSTASIDVDTLASVGSSPHTRGALQGRKSPLRFLQDRPRIRGEHPHEGPAGHQQRGIIPAYAGSTFSSSVSWSMVLGSSPHTRGALLQAISRARLSRDHPRIRGEHSAIDSCVWTWDGIIPAYAGSTRIHRGA